MRLTRWANREAQKRTLGGDIGVRAASGRVPRVSLVVVGFVQVFIPLVFEASNRGNRWCSRRSR